MHSRGDVTVYITLTVVMVRGKGRLIDICLGNRWERESEQDGVVSSVFVTGKRAP